MACHVGRAGMHPLKQAILQTTSHVGHSLGGAPIFENLLVHLGEDGLSFNRAQRRPGAYLMPADNRQQVDISPG